MVRSIQRNRRSELLSRLKGIETKKINFYNFLFVFVRNYFPVWRELKRRNRRIQHKSGFLLVRNYFPVWRELKRTPWCLPRTFPCSELLSRLKGIETSKIQNFSCFLLSSELLSRLKGIETLNWVPILWVTRVRNYFPVWRELKLIPLLVSVVMSICSELLSRLKGIETQSIYMTLSPFSVFGTTFPFEGNWNFHKHYWLHQPILVRNYFPVWRELKLFFLIEPEVCFFRGFGTTFPFEGNWNLKY